MPNSNEQLAYSILCANNIAVLRRIGRKKYAFFGDVPDFYNELFPPLHEGGKSKREADDTMLEYFELACVTPWDYSPMLEVFLEEAEEFFNEDKPGSISSGVWQEDGKLEEVAALVAKAIRFGEEQLLVIKLLREEFVDRVNILRKARIQMLENRQLAKSIGLFKEKSKLDTLTKILNKASFTEILLEEIEKTRSSGTSLAITMLDIDDFAKVNETYGHVVGDKILESLGQLLLAALRRNDIMARYGGEEFVILIPRSTRKQALRMSEELRRNIAETHIAQFPLTASFGCTLYQQGESLQDLVKRAELAVLEAKRMGKNTVCSL